MATPAPSLYRFAGHELDPVRRELRLAQAGTIVTLPPRAFDVLLLLVRRPGELLSKAELLDDVWPNTFVEENSVERAIHLLRRVLDSRGGNCILTDRGRGYRFTAPVQATSEQSAIPLPPAVAVLPFANVTGDADHAYLADGIAEELIHALATTGHFRVAARTSSFAYRGRELDVRKLGQELGVEAIVEGAVHQAGERLRVTAQLISTQTGFQLRAYAFDRQRPDMLSLPGELAGEIVDVMLKSGQSSKATSVTGASTGDVEAYHLYLRARALLARTMPSGLSLAMQLLDQALDRDPRFLRAIAEKALIRTVMLTFGMKQPGQLAAAEREARAALTGDATLARAHQALGNVLVARSEWSQAESHYDQACRFEEELEARITRIWQVTLSVGHLGRALAQAERIRNDAPRTALAAVAVAFVGSMLRRDEEALRYVELAGALGWPVSLPPAAEIHFSAKLRGGRFADGIAHLLGSAGLQDVATELGGSLDDPELRAAAVQKLRVVIRDVVLGGLDNVRARRLLILLVAIGAVDDAFDLLDQWLAHIASEDNVSNVWALLWIPEMRAFRAHHRFRDVTSRLGLVAYWHLHGPPDGYDLLGDQLVEVAEANCG